MSKYYPMGGGKRGQAYIAGPMRGRRHFNFGSFDAAAAIARAEGWVVFNPADRDRAVHGFDPIRDDMAGTTEELTAAGFNLREALGADLQWIAAEADAVIFLKEFQYSSGAMAECAVALALGLDCYRVNILAGAIYAIDPIAMVTYGYEEVMS